MTEWRAISARIAALVDVGAFFFKTNESDSYGAADILVKNASETALNLRQLLNVHGTELPEGSKACLQLFFKDCRERFREADENNPFGRPDGFSGVAGVLTSLASFRAEFEYLIADSEAVARSLVIRAFIHLQRSIVADDLVRERWSRAFEAGETACESLGACQLLAHGIWAFKTSAAGERTDLVLGGALGITDEIRRASQGLVLTEWKRVRNPSESPKKLDEAYEQAKRYRDGILAGFEIASLRYLVIVSKDHLEMPDPRREGEVTFEFRNIAIAPSTPSLGARVVVNSVVPT